MAFMLLQPEAQPAASRVRNSWKPRFPGALYTSSTYRRDMSKKSKNIDKFS